MKDFQKSMIPKGTIVKIVFQGSSTIEMDGIVGRVTWSNENFIVLEDTFEPGDERESTADFAKRYMNAAKDSMVGGTIINMQKVAAITELLI